MPDSPDELSGGQIVRAAGSLLSALGALTLLQSDLSVGRSLSLLLAGYQQLRDAAFAPLDLIGLDLPDRAKTLVFLGVSLVSGFIARGGPLNRTAAVGAIGAATLGAMGAALFGLIKALGAEEVFSQFDYSVQPGIDLYIQFGTFYVAGLISLLLIMPVEIWAIVIVLPFVPALLTKTQKMSTHKRPDWFWETLGFGCFMVASALRYSTRLTFWSFKRLMPETAERWQTDVSQLDRFDDLWSLQEYLAYYKPLRDVAVAMLSMIIIGRVVFDTLNQ